MFRCGPVISPCFAPPAEGSGAASPAALDTVVIPVAGLGTRMLPLTMSAPKNLLPLGDKTLIHYAVREAALAGARKIVIVCSAQEEALYRAQFQASEKIATAIATPGKEDLKASVDEVVPMATGCISSFSTNLKAWVTRFCRPRIISVESHSA